MRGKRGRRVRIGAAVRFPFWVGFPRRVNQRRVTTRSPEPFHLGPGVSSRIIGEVSQFPSDSHSCCHTAGHQLYDRNPPRLCKVHLLMCWHIFTGRSGLVSTYAVYMLLTCVLFHLATVTHVTLLQEYKHNIWASAVPRDCFGPAQTDPL